MHDLAAALRQNAASLGKSIQKPVVQKDVQKPVAQDVQKPAIQKDVQKQQQTPNKAAEPKSQVSKGRSATDMKFEEGGKFSELPGAKMGEVVVRFPPEASGFMHIGHAKAALLNYHYKDIFNGKLILRFDDTNPAKENAAFEEAILEDLPRLGVKWDDFTFTSNYFDQMIDMCTQMIKDGKAYADDTDAETMRAQREERKESACRNNCKFIKLHFPICLTFRRSYTVLCFLSLSG